ncbi:MAG TPA: hypothetical protein VGA49_00505 [Patescibacteria group bacterium]|jgi:hypothetical protein
MARKLGYALIYYFLAVLAFLAIDYALVDQMFKQAGWIILAGGGSFLIARTYFHKTPGDAKAGAELAILWIGLGVVLDFLLGWLALMAGEQASYDLLLNLYTSLFFWAGLGVSFLGITFAGHFTHGGALMKIPPPAPGKNIKK